MVESLLNEMGEWGEDMAVVKAIAMSFYSQVFRSATHAGGEFILGKFSEWPEEHHRQLDAMYSMDETRKSFMSMGSIKAPGPDGFQSIFFKGAGRLLDQRYKASSKECWKAA